MALFTMRDSWNVWRRKVNEAIGGGGDPIESKNVVYDNTDSGLTATNVQSAIDEVAGDVNALKTTVGDSSAGLVKDVTALKDGATIKSVTYTAGEKITNHARCRINVTNNIAVCNLAFQVSESCGNGTDVLSITDSTALPANDVFAVGVFSGTSFAFKLDKNTAKITIEQLATGVTIPSSTGVFGTLTWVAGN